MKMVRISTLGKEIASKQRRLGRFRDDESGSMIVFSMFLFMLIMIVSGMAVDFMRFESRRAMMQGALDSAVLAAADLDQELDPKAVVVDHLTKSQVGNCLVGEPSIESTASYRRVEADCELELDTFFLGLRSFVQAFDGPETLTARATSVAIEGVGNIEVSLVLDISGSMDDDIPGSGGTKRIERLREAGTAFVAALLKPEYEDKVSLSLIPYSEDVNLGEDLFNTISTAAYASTADQSKNSRHTHSYCLNLPASAFTSTAWNNTASYTQVPHFQWNPVYNSGGNLVDTIDQPVCPHNSYEAIIPISQNATQLSSAINQLQPRAGTSIFLGLKWAVNLLDPSFQDNIAALPNGVIDEAFDGRPVAHGTSEDPSDTLKYIVLMTDGQNSSSSRVNEDYYNEPNHVDHWANMNWWYFYNYRAGGSYYKNRSEFVNENVYTHDLGNQYMRSMCTAAKDKGIIIFSIAMGSTTAGEVEMSNCASSTGHYYSTSGEELVDIFEAIAKQITDLRLTL